MHSYAGAAADRKKAAKANQKQVSLRETEAGSDRCSDNF